VVVVLALVAKCQNQHMAGIHDLEERDIAGAAEME
jgi:hypothetical protein